MCVSGCPTPLDGPEGAASMAAMALDMVAAVEHFVSSNGHRMQIRIGMHSGTYRRVHGHCVLLFTLAPASTWHALTQAAVRRDPGCSPVSSHPYQQDRCDLHMPAVHAERLVMAVRRRKALHHRHMALPQRCMSLASPLRQGKVQILPFSGPVGGPIARVAVGAAPACVDAMSPAQGRCSAWIWT
jgi:hypothetical protein